MTGNDLFQEVIYEETKFIQESKSNIDELITVKEDRLKK